MTTLPLVNQRRLLVTEVNLQPQAIGVLHDGPDRVTRFKLQSFFESHTDTQNISQSMAPFATVFAELLAHQK